MNFNFYILIVISFIFNIYYASAIKCQTLHDTSKHLNDRIKFEYRTVECSGLCYRKDDANFNKTLGCTTDPVNGIENMHNATIPRCFIEYKGNYVLCLCNWDNCNIMKLEFLQDEIIKHNNSSDKLKISLTILITIIMTLFK
uniref:Activin_recp domain-containing protein n=1 Tax=Strongyloides papillosus TaxID=174720 RepID=A0A0N5C240_STREA